MNQTILNDFVYIQIAFTYTWTNINMWRGKVINDKKHIQHHKSLYWNISNYYQHYCFLLYK